MSRIIHIILLGVGVFVLEYAVIDVAVDSIRHDIRWHRIYIQWGILDESKHLGY